MNRLTALLTILLFSALAFGLVQHQKAEGLQDKVATLKAALSAPPTYTITRVMDGDTFEIDHGLARIRLAGVSVPETWEKGPGGKWQKIADPDPRGKAAAKYMESLTGRQVRLEVVARDSYGRTLARAYLMPGEADVGKYLASKEWTE